jgi:FAD/FMN-containing dehydrogenase
MARRCLLYLLYLLYLLDWYESTCFTSTKVLAAQLEALWKLRESIPLALVLQGRIFKYDLSVPLADMYALCTEMRARLKAIPEALVFGYGHLGDGHLCLCIKDACCRLLAYADERWRMLTHADVCWRMLAYPGVC